MSSASARWYPLHLVALLAVLLAVQAPRLGGRAADFAHPVFARDRGFDDLDGGYYPAAQTVRRDPSELYSRHELRTDASSRRGPAFVNLPLVAWLFVPLTALSRERAGAVLLGVNVALTLAALLLIQRRVLTSVPLRWAVTAAFMTSGPVYNALSLGQITPLTFVLLLLSERALHRGQKRSAGFWLGLACVIKVPPLILVPYLVLRRQWRVLAGMSGVLLGVSVVSLLLYGWSIHVAYYETAILRYWGTALAAHYNQSLDGTLARLFTTASLWSWEPLPVLQEARELKWAIGAGLLILCAGALRWTDGPVPERRTLLEMGMMMCLSLVALPIAWVHYGVWLLPVAVIVGGALGDAGHSARARQCAAGLLAVAVLLINVPVPPPWVIERLDHMQWFRVVISHQFAGTLMLLLLCVWCLRRLPEAGSRPGVHA